jgi:hypothetical protein
MLRAALLAILCGSIGWAIWLVAVGGFNSTILGVRIRSNNPARVVFVALLALGGYWLAGGRLALGAPAARVRGWVQRVARHPGAIAGAMATAAVFVAMAGSTRIAGGSDAYGYVSQADLWLAGDLKVRQPWVEQVPWPNRAWTFAPLGYRPLDGQSAIVPTYSSGLPMLMAAAKLFGGQCAMFAVVPLSLGLAVIAVYGLGRRLGSAFGGVIAGWLVATSPVVLEVAVESLTDVPVMAAWSIAFYFLLGTGVRSALTAGLCAALAILIRPNLVPLAVPMVTWFFVRRLDAPGTLRTRLAQASAFALGALPGVAAVAAINRELYGSAASSGYGGLAASFAWAHVLPNLTRFLQWIVETQTPLAILGLLAVVFPVRRVWPCVADRTVFAVIWLYVAVLWGQYSAYLEFNDAGYLRFLLPSWPFMMLGLAGVLLAIGRASRPGAQALVAGVVLALGVWQMHTAVRRDVFEQRQAARHDAPLGRLVRAHTHENSVILTFHRSGSLRYYAGRTTARYDMLDPDWLDRAVAWMTARGVHVYALLDAGEMAEFKRRFATQHLASALNRPLLIYEPVGATLHNLSQSSTGSSPVIVVSEPPSDVPGCDPPQVRSTPRFRSLH